MFAPIFGMLSVDRRKKAGTSPAFTRDEEGLVVDAGADQEVIYTFDIT